jgi:hypothetical protein
MPRLPVGAFDLGRISNAALARYKCNRILPAADDRFDVHRLVVAGIFEPYAMPEAARIASFAF